MSHHKSSLGLITAPILGGVERLWQDFRTLAINGVAVTPSCWFDQTGLDATAKTWTCRETGTVLSLAGAGAEPDFAFPVPGRPGMRGCKFGGAKRLAAPNNTFGAITTEDLFVVALVRPDSTAATCLIGKYTGVGPWWRIGCHQVGSGERLFLTIHDGTGEVANYPTAASAVANSWNLFVCGANRNEASANGCRLGINGGIVGTVDVSARQASLDKTTTPFAIGGDPGAGAQFAGAVGFFALFVQPNWFSAGAACSVEILALARQLASAFWGYSAAHSHASLTPTQLPTRTVAAYEEGFA